MPQLHHPYFLYTNIVYRAASSREGIGLAFDIRKIKYFLAVIEHANVSNRAEALRISQPQTHSLE
jgi:hypothetical protein